uniref:Uncharacterized protein n=1 Tax=Anguilla anguilla TaxID=7936 RepID=A0A0E9R200_ANGAN
MGVTIHCQMNITESMLIRGKHAISAPIQIIPMLTDMPTSTKLSYRTWV